MKKYLLFICITLLFLVIAGVASAQESYTHPSEAFSLTEFGTLEDETDYGALFVADDAQVMVLFGETTVELSEEMIPSVVGPVLDGVQDFESYELLTDDAEIMDDGSMFVPFTYTPEGDYGVGEIYVTQADGVLYILILITADYDATYDAWVETVDSFTPGLLVESDELPLDEEEDEDLPVDETEDEEEVTNTTPSQTEGDVFSGFDPSVDGFSFYNYGDDIPATDLTPVELQRMFGDGVCASLANDECILTPPAQQWMEQINSYMSGGHCEGMAVLSALMYYDQVQPDDFGSSQVNDLVLDGNDPLQREIAYWWTTQATYPGSTLRVSESPTAVVNALMENFQEGQDATEWWALGFYKRDGSDGHAVTPIGVDDQGDGIVHILVYDNNYPDESRSVIVDTNTDTWQYEGSPNPEIESDLYDGDAETQSLELVAISPRLEQQECDFCSGDFAAEGELLNAAPRQSARQQSAESVDNPIWQDIQTRWALLIYGETDDFYQIWLLGKPDLLVIDDWGRRIGYDQGEFVNEIPGAATTNMRIFQQSTGLDKDKSPVLRIPVGLSFEVIADATLMEEAGSSDISIIGPGYYLDVSDMYLEPGDVESIAIYIDKSRHQLTYYTDYSESPDIELGLETDEADYAMMVRATELTGEEDAFDIGLDTDTNEFILNTSYNTEPSTYEIYVLQIDDEGERVFGASDVVMEPDNTAYIPFTEFDEDAAALRVDFDYENDGEIDEMFELPDVTDEIDFYAEENAGDEQLEEDDSNIEEEDDGK